MSKKAPKEWKRTQVNNILHKTMKETKYPWSCWGRSEGQDSSAIVGIYTVYTMCLQMQSSRHDFWINSKES